LTANHGGGYSYRLCRVPEFDPITEECFQKIPLSFVGDTQEFRYAGQWIPGAPVYTVPTMKVNQGTHPPGSEWIRLSIPACRYCDEGQFCGGEVAINFTEVSGQIPWGGDFYGGAAWVARVDCASICSGATVDDGGPPPPTNNQSYGLSDGQLCPPGKTQFTETVPGLSGFLANHTYPERSIIAMNIVDKVRIPKDLPDGRYLLGWRWDAEQTYQIWQNCADILIKGDAEEPVAPPPPVDNSWRTYFIVGVTVGGAVSLISIGIAVYSCQKKSSNSLREPLKTRSVQ